MAQPTENKIVTLTAEKLSKRFNTEWLFRDFNYSFQQGKTYAITGPNGSGKSTLLQILWGQLPPTSGTLRYELHGKAVDVENVFQHVAIAAPYMDLVDEFTLKEMVEFHFRLKPILPGYSPEQVLSEMNLPGAINKAIGNFSSGMKQRLKLGLAFYSDVPVLFLDEPGTNLDQKSFTWYLNLLNTLSKDRLILIASNNKEEFAGFAEILEISDFKPETR